jgi:hypothetical protein
MADEIYEHVAIPDDPSEPQPNAQPAAAPAPAAAPTPAPEPTAAATPSPAPAATPPQQVPLQALLEERTKRQNMQRLLEETNSKIKALEERLTPAKPQPPAFDENPAEHLKTRQDMTDAELQILRAEREEARKVQAQNRAAQEMHAYVEQSEAQFRATVPDYDEAAKHLNASRAAEFQALGYSPSQAQMLVYQDALAVAWEAKQREMDPAKVFYELAKLRGYTGKAQQPPPAVSAAATLDVVQRGLAKTGGLGPSGGDDGDVTFARLAQMDEDDFNKATQGDAWRKLMGG